MYNGKSRHIWYSYNTIIRLLSTRIIFVDYLKSKNNLANPLIKGLNKELIAKILRGMRLKPMKKFSAKENRTYDDGDSKN